MYEARLLFEARLSGYRYYLYNWFFTSTLFGIVLMFILQCGFLLVPFIYWLANRAPHQESRFGATNFEDVDNDDIDDDDESTGDIKEVKNKINKKKRRRKKE